MILRSVQAAVAATIAVLVGWHLWADAAADTPDPYDHSRLWQTGILVAFGLGVLGGSRIAPPVVALCLVAYPTYWTFTQASDSAFGPIGVVFLLIWACFAGIFALAGVFVRRAVEARVHQSH